MRPKSSAQSGKADGSTHRVYLNTGGDDLIRCRVVGAEALVRMAQGSDRIEVYETGPNRLQRSELMRLTSPLSALSWAQADLVTDPATLKRSLARAIGDRLARLRLKIGRHLLAAEILHHENGIEQKVLLLVLARTDVLTCDWQRAS
jgi:hypothetical protein